MELVTTLSSKKNLRRLVDYRIDGIIAGGVLSSRFHYSLEDLKEINDYCKRYQVKLYISIDEFVKEDDKPKLYEYMEFLNSLLVAGIYFNDLAVIEAAKTFNMTSLLIYDGGPILTNTLDIAYYTNMGISGAVLPRELTFEEYLDIFEENQGNLDMQIFGHLRMSTSKRKFLSNYFKEINSNYNPVGKTNLKIVEEQREYGFPIIEDEYGTRIYSDFVFIVYRELPFLKKVLRRGIIDDQFLDSVILFDIVRDYQEATEDNCHFLEKSLLRRYADISFGSGYLYQKTNVTKDEEEKN